MNKETIKQSIKDIFEDVYNFHCRENYQGEQYDKFFSKTGLTFVANEDVERHDSYGYEDSTLQRIFKHEESGKYFMFTGTRCSYEGEMWEDIKEVKPKTKTTAVYE